MPLAREADVEQGNPALSGGNSGNRSDLGLWSMRWVHSRVVNSSL